MLITLNQVIGWTAHNVVRQHPFNSVEGLPAVIERIKALPQWDRSVADFAVVRLGKASELVEMLRPTIFGTPEGEAWNTPRSQHKSRMVSASRYGGPAREDDFIDLDALLNNIVLGCWRESNQVDGTDEPAFGPVAEATP